MELTVSRPRVVVIMYVWSVLMACFYLAVAVLLAMLFMSQANEMKDMPPLFHAFRTALVGLIGVFAVAYAIMPVLPRRRPVWIYGIVLLGLACTSLITAPVSVPILIFWVKPRVRTMFNVGSPGTASSSAAGV